MGCNKYFRMGCPNTAGRVSPCLRHAGGVTSQQDEARQDLTMMGKNSQDLGRVFVREESTEVEGDARRLNKLSLPQQ